MGGGIGRVFRQPDPRAEAAKKTSNKIMQVLAKKKGEVDKSGQPMSFEK
jgi:citrate synthase